MELSLEAQLGFWNFTTSQVKSNFIYTADLMQRATRCGSQKWSRRGPEYSVYQQKYKQPVHHRLRPNIDAHNTQQHTNPFPSP